MATVSKWTMDSTEAQNYTINPLFAPDPSDETGLNSSFRSAFAPPTESRESLILQQERFRQQPERFHPQDLQSAPLLTDPSPRSRSVSGRPRSSSNASPPSMLMNKANVPIRRGQSLNHGHGHKSQKHRPRVSHQPIDIIDSLDFSPGGPYHHEGPYDSTLISSNLNSQTSPVAAVAESNAAALKATPRENIMDAVLKHRPLDGTASVPPGMRDNFGRRYSYEENNVMADAGYGKWMWVGEDLDEVQKAEMNKDPTWKIRNDYPSSVDESSSSTHGAVTLSSPEDIELEQTRPKKAFEIQEQEVDGEGATRISRSHSLREGLKRRIGSLRRKKAE